jgi:hypothetical protein
MVTGYGGTYRGSVVDTADPAVQNRLRILVPEISGSDTVWAVPSLSPGTIQMPELGDEVAVFYERGDTDYPIWEASAVAEAGEPAKHGFIGKYRAVVVDNVDPEMQNRLQVSVPEVYDAGSMWARAGLSLTSDTPPPEIGTGVWVEFENGDPNYPIWVGVS